MSSYVIAGPVDSEDGTLFWSNDDGWGFLSTATVFTEAEWDTGKGNLPMDDDARWVRMPAVQTPQEVFMVWDTARVMKGESPELLSIFGSVDDAIDYAKQNFPDPEDDWQYAQIENWIVGEDHPQATYTLAENQGEQHA
jgi:hypothetical protein